MVTITTILVLVLVICILDLPVMSNVVVGRVPTTIPMPKLVCANIPLLPEINARFNVPVWEPNLKEFVLVPIPGYPVTPVPLHVLVLVRIIPLLDNVNVMQTSSMEILVSILVFVVLSIILTTPAIVPTHGLPEPNVILNAMTKGFLMTVLATVSVLRPILMGLMIVTLHVTTALTIPRILVFLSNMLRPIYKAVIAFSIQNSRPILYHDILVSDFSGLKPLWIKQNQFIF